MFRCTFCSLVAIKLDFDCGRVCRWNIRHMPVGCGYVAASFSGETLCSWSSSAFIGHGLQCGKSEMTGPIKVSRLLLSCVQHYLRAELTRASCLRRDRHRRGREHVHEQPGHAAHRPRLHAALHERGRARHRGHARQHAGLRRCGYGQCGVWGAFCGHELVWRGL